MSQSHRITGGTADEAFKVQCFPWERGASVGGDLFHFLLRAQYLFNTLEERKKHNRSPFTPLLPSFTYVLFDIRFDQIKGYCWAMVEVCTLILFKPEIDMG